MTSNNDKATINTDKVEVYLDKIESLPPTPTVLVKLIEEFRKPDVDPDEVVQWLQRDPALAAEVLRRCNSSFYGTGTPINDMGDAVFRLGFYELYQITVYLFGMQALTVKKEIPGFSAEKLRLHSSISAIAAGSLSTMVKVPEGMMFTAGLLHDIGKLVLALGEAAGYAELIAESKRAGKPVSQVERETLGFDHAEIGAHLLRRWGVPEEVVLPVFEHTQACGANCPRLETAIINAASALADHLESGATQPFSQTDRSKPIKEYFKLTDEQIDAWESPVRSKVAEVQAADGSAK